MDSKLKKGGCLCGAVTYEITGPLRNSMACHCVQCRKTSGHFVSASAALKTDLKVCDNGGLKWYQSSPNARRGFCCECGSSLFWDLEGRDLMGIMSGTLDGSTGIETSSHIFVAMKGDYYSLEDTLPKYDGYPDE